VQLVDSHCHLPLIERGPRNMDEFLAESAAAGVSHILCVAVDLPSYPGVLALAEAHPNIYATVGVHPNSERDHEPDVAQLVALAAHPRVVGIGETGLDFYRQQGDVEWQYERFRAHIRAAIECGKPLVIHTRDSAAATVEVLRSERAERIGGVMHCFVEDWETARAAMDLGFYISFSGIVTFKTATALQDVAKRVPLERLLVETDAPWLAPVPKRGKQNEPAYVRHTAEFLARLRGESLEALAAATTANFFRLFSHAV
jgi:TatD DNase family protein